MHQFTSKYLGDLRTEITHLASESIIQTDAPTDNNGKGERFSPTDLVSVALGSCMVTIMGILANREGIALDGLTWKTQKIMSASPRKIQEIAIVITLPNSTLTDVEKQKLTRAALTCPVALSLHPDLIQRVTFEL